MKAYTYTLVEDGIEFEIPVNAESREKADYNVELCFGLTCQVINVKEIA